MKTSKMQNWVVGDTPESCIPLGNQTARDHGLPPDYVVRAKSAEEAIDKAEKARNKKAKVASYNRDKEK